MRPDDPNNRRVGTPLIPQRSLLHTQSQPPKRDMAAQKAAANIVRSQLDSIYGGNTVAQPPQTTPVTPPAETAAPIAQQAIEAKSPYERTQSNPAVVEADQWKQYHSAWQDYYQKYYERYYVGQIYHTRQALEAKAQQASSGGEPQESTAVAETPQVMDRNEALYDLRSKLIDKVQDSAQKVRKSRHFVPITAALCVVLLFLFLQYNRVLFANVEAYISPGNIDPANIIIDPTTEVAVNPEPKLIIPKINVDVPVVYNTSPDHDSQMKAMEGGVAYFGIPGANSKPGQVGNTVLSGHSSNDIIDQGNYKFIFARLDHLVNGDTIYLNYESKRYTYTVTRKEVVTPKEINKLVYPTDKPVLTLITCTPLGTALNRLLVTAEQVSPSPAGATAAPTETTNDQPPTIPGNSPTFLQRIFGGGNE